MERSGAGWQMKDERQPTSPKKVLKSDLFPVLLLKSAKGGGGVGSVRAPYVGTTSRVTYYRFLPRSPETKNTSQPLKTND